MSSRETRILAFVILLAAPALLWPIRRALNGHTLETFAYVGAFAFAGAGLVVGAIVGWNWLVSLFNRSGSGPDRTA